MDHSAGLVQFNPTNISAQIPEVIAAEHTSAGALSATDNVQLRFMATDGSVYSSGPTLLDNSNEVSPGLLGSWSQRPAISPTASVLPSAAYPRLSDTAGNAIEKPGLGIFAKSHEVVSYTGNYHISLRLTPRNQALWRSKPLSVFVHQDEYGNYFATIGAGPQPQGCSGGMLTSGVNRARDWSVAPVDLEVLPVPSMFEDAVIERLLQLNLYYRNELPYYCWPDPGTIYYNSNWYASGLMNAARLPPPMFPVLRPVYFPGWWKKVPVSEFQPQ